jgi:hypothetical protein
MIRALPGLLAGLVLAAGILAVGEATRPDSPSCPTEDSCAIDYSDGRWTVTEVTP